jgi:hypothetical protein
MTLGVRLCRKESAWQEVTVYGADALAAAAAAAAAFACLLAYSFGVHVLSSRAWICQAGQAQKGDTVVCPVYSFGRLTTRSVRTVQPTREMLSTDPAAS